MPFLQQTISPTLPWQRSSHQAELMENTNRRRKKTGNVSPFLLQGWGTASSRARTVLWSSFPWQVCPLGSVSTTYSPRDGCRLLILLISSFLTTSRYRYLVPTMCRHWCTARVQEYFGYNHNSGVPGTWSQKALPTWWEQDAQFSGSVVIKSTLTVTRAGRPVLVPP